MSRARIPELRMNSETLPEAGRWLSETTETKDRARAKHHSR